MSKALKIMNIVIPSSAAAICAIVPLAVYGAEKAYQASHFDVSYEKDLISLSNPHAILHKDYRTKITAVDPSLVVSRVEIFVGDGILDPDDYVFNSETSELFIVGDYIKKTSLFIYPYLSHEGKFHFFEDEEGIVKEKSVNDEFNWRFAFYDEYVEPEDLKVIPSIKTVSGTGLVPREAYDFITLSHDDELHVWYADVELKFQQEIPRPQEEHFKLIFHFISGISGKPIDQEFDEVFGAKLVN